MSNSLVISNMTMPVLNVSKEVAEVVNAKITAQYDAAVANLVSSVSRLSFQGRRFNLTHGGITKELSDLVLDAYIVAINPKHHYTFYEKAYAGSDSDGEGRILSRYPTPEDAIDFIPTSEWASRAYKQRAVLMLADGSDELYIADFGYNSIRKTGDDKAGLYNLQQLITGLHDLHRRNENAHPFMFVVQLSFTRASVSELQFSLVDQRPGSDNTYRIAPQKAVDRMVEAIYSGEVDRLLDIEYDSNNNRGTSMGQPVVQPSMGQPVVQPSMGQPVVQPSMGQPVVQPSMGQPVVQPSMGQNMPVIDDVGDFAGL